MTLITICGPTATGKSGLALDLAHRLGSIILSADSRQIYKYFNIGTAKPTIKEQQLVSHYLIDICEPTEILTLAEYQKQAQSFIQSPGSQTDVVLPTLLVGGTGLYIKAIVKGLKIPRVGPNEKLRSQLANLGQKQCYKMLQQVDQVAVEKIHPNDVVRTLRALEVFYVSGKPISQQQGEDLPNYPILQIGLDCDVEVLGERIRDRTEKMVEVGLVEEVKCLCEKYGEKLPLLNTLGYAEMKQYLAGDISLAEAIKATVLHTRQFAKRQRTWFRGYPEIEWFDGNAPNLLDKVWERVREFTRILAEKTQE
ncbi:MAG: tRNA (adenosine(37)-N6)-dimethylallyltransferase MiaA [Trichodesmium sp. St16_bin4-tuft]|uniref:tRNA dimethylallyltransferase n=1 Tax=Trichodesmium erythraeum (strain IMS101) TaxID=203124 RepID=MIAA_TRIEI|nr:RecName: Full=tRNA dimethylallyltransferase; AltName: Full=Dimethylallyl diphosphate:tRNA dimethylallyltransferase; Short=DMAPP:tRNA dimethylallyltransferase; Short=DMATase; AltName: Full=Isopentenyl-diphosphate:tRNA isopentenyltransferase; Short=IPP transferase; Short=IPPT; Short=IPTase [Trichodesmium erythraeum IMS101]MBS9771114.1 tRNA (adenosine(37)-N6)-dimethylallyltransferase MiaA [Trichodesmium erythraeum GBRTRLIN201]MCH2048289.1 tRNA (adenosine(37)-N6)-dimethylallyltransferase MiaA [Tri